VTTPTSALAPHEFSCVVCGASSDQRRCPTHRDDQLARGSTRAWRKLRDTVLARDNGLCHYPVAPGRICGEPATVAGHILARADGGSDALTNLRAECAMHSNSRGASGPPGRGIPIPPSRDPLPPLIA
jgi:5-methylcytosine-specific restriction endonuclease McrA